MQVISYTATLPAKLLNDHRRHSNNKYLTLLKFIEGVTAAGDQGVIEHAQVHRPSAVAFMLGWVHELGKKSPHLLFRQRIVDQQLAQGARTVIADSNLFLYKNSQNPQYYLRYSFDGVFPGTGEYCDHVPDPARWQKIRSDLGMDLRPWRSTGDHVLLCLQRNGGWSMGGVNVVDWAIDTIKILRLHSDRRILVRAHPGDKGGMQDAASVVAACQHKGLRKISQSQHRSDFMTDLQSCWAVVNHNSSPAVGAAIEGVPIFVTDPDHSQARAVANSDLAQIETPVTPERQHWVERLSQFHWNFDEISNGTAWRHMRQWAIRK